MGRSDGAVSGEFDAVAYINEPRWQKVSLGLERINLLMEKLGHPEQGLHYVHVAGTNGKGSTCAYVASILQEARYTVGLFTSPYIEVFEERIRVNGENIPGQALTEITLQVRDYAAEVEAELGEHPTEFELMTAVALCYFAQRACDLVVLEVGLGGRLDSTNCIPAPEVCAIARLGLDHTAILGSTLEEIAGEKAGIVKPGAAVISYPQEPEAAAVIRTAAAEAGARVVEPDMSAVTVGPVCTQMVGGQTRLYRVFSCGEFSNLHTWLLGAYQPYNAALALQIIQALKARGWRVPDKCVRAGVAATNWPGRFEVLPKTAGEPWVVIDGGHNPQGICALCDTLSDVFPVAAPIVVMSVLADKDHASMTETLADVAGAFVAVTPPNVRALPAADLAAELREQCDACGRFSVPVLEAADFTDARQKAFELAEPRPDRAVVVISGSLYSVSSAKAAFL